jgi:hypothetical protein
LVWLTLTRPREEAAPLWLDPTWSIFRP